MCLPVFLCTPESDKIARQVVPASEQHVKPADSESEDSSESNGDVDDSVTTIVMSS